MNRSLRSTALRSQQNPLAAIPGRQPATIRYQADRNLLKPLALGSVGLSITAPDKKVLQVNDQLCEMLGYSVNELRGLSWPEFTYSPDLAQGLYLFGRMCAGEIDNYSLPKRFIRKQGDLIETVISVTCVRKADGVIDSIVGLVEAVRARQQPEKRSQEFFKELTFAHGSSRQSVSRIGGMQQGLEPSGLPGDVFANVDSGQLTHREVDVLILLTEGLSHKDVAAKLGISVRTVDAHARNIMRKAGVHNATDLVRFALRNQIISI